MKPDEREAMAQQIQTEQDALKPEPMSPLSRVQTQL